MDVLRQYSASVVSALKGQDGEALRKSFDTFGPSARPFAERIGNLSFDDIDRVMNGYPEFGDFIALQVKKLIAVHVTNAADQAYDFASTQLSGYVKFVRETELNWTVPALLLLAKDIGTLALRADQQKSDGGLAKTKESNSMIMQCFSTCNDRTHDLAATKKIGVIFITNLLFKSYFHLNTLHLCNNLINAIEKPAFPDFKNFPSSHIVTYQYYTGRIAMFDDNYTRADQQLTKAFKDCHGQAKKNRRLILEYLIPVKLLMGTLPREELLKKYNLLQFSDICAALRVGNLGLFCSSLEKHQEYFIQRGIYLILEKLKIITYRNLLKKVWLIKATHQIDIEWFVAAIKWCGMETDTDEVECILCNMIFKGFVKGYIAHKNGKLVLKKSQPFPAIKDTNNQ